MYTGGLVLFLLFLPAHTRRSIRLDGSHQDALQRNSVGVKGLKSSAEAREALIPGVLAVRAFHRPRPRAGALREVSDRGGRRAANLGPHRAAPRYDGPRRLNLALQYTGGPKEDRLMPREEAAQAGAPLLSAPRRRSCPACSATSDAEIIEQTERWLDGFVIALNLCPFAKGARKETKVVVCRGDSSRAASVVMRELRALRAIDLNKRGTTLIVLPHFREFEALMDFQVQAEALAETGDASAGVQLLAFHPNAQFNAHFTDVQEDPADVSMRSPWPMLHLLRDADVVAAEERWAAAHAPEEAPPIQEQNAAYLRGLGLEGASNASRAAWSRVK